MSSSRIRGRADPSGEPEAARRVFKRLKNGLASAEEMSAEEYGLLYLYYPFVLPDVEVSA